MFILLVIALFCSFDLKADGIAVQGYNLSHNQNFILLEETPSNNRNIFELKFSNVESPLVEVDENNKKTNKKIVEEISSIYLGGVYKINSTLSIAGEIGIHNVEINDEDNGSALSDARFNINHGFGQWKGLELAFSTFLELPTGDKDLYLSNDSLGVGSSFIMAKNWNDFRFIGSVGGQYASQAKYKNIDYSKQFLFSGGVNYKLQERLSASLEIETSYLIDDEDSTLGQGDLMGGLHYKDQKGNAWQLGAGVGNVEEHSDSSWRVVAGINIGIEEPTAKSTGKNCTLRPFSVSYHARPILKNETPKKNELPYISTKNRKVPLLNIGESTGIKDGVPYVKDSQVVFAVDLFDLPLEKNVKKIKHIRLRLPLFKSKNKDPIYSELFCEYRHKLCFGQWISSKKWRQNLNKSFYENVKMDEEYFKYNFLNNNQKKNSYNKELSIDLLKAWGLSKAEGKRILYKDGLRDKTFYFVAADDLFVSNNVYIDLAMEEEVCTYSK